ncbi:MAG: HlyD family efflux transporter periplasmic adaptor subunit, partial [Clostridiales bacterium]|nr:HlyD family efflux transporter periplasmic adaptor subunit [Clostridiales bacterium]
YVYKETEVTYGTLVMGITESGSVEAELLSMDYLLDLSVASEDEDSEDDDDEEEEEAEQYLKIETADVVVGQRVTAGDAIYKLTQDSIDDVRRKLKANVTDLEIALSEAKLSYNLDVLSAQYDYKKTLTKLNSASGVYNNEVAQANDEVAQLYATIDAGNLEIISLQSQLDEILESDDYETITETYEELKSTVEAIGTDNVLIYIPYETKYLAAKTKYDNLMNQIDQLETGIITATETVLDGLEELNEVQNRLSLENMEATQTYETTSLDGQLAKSEYEYTIGTLEESVNTAQTDLDEAAQQLADFEAFVGDGTIYAESDGLIMSMEYEADDYLINTGSMFTYTTDDSLTLTVDVSQEDITDIEVLDSVSILFTAYPEVTYTGVVTSITTTATSDTATTISYPVTIQIQGDTSQLYDGMTGDVTFVVDEKSDILYVSRKAIVEENGNTYVYLKDNSGNYYLSEVTTGFSDGVNIEITSGIEADDIVYIASKVTSEGMEADE